MRLRERLTQEVLRDAHVVDAVDLRCGDIASLAREADRACQHREHQHQECHRDQRFEQREAALCSRAMRRHHGWVLPSIRTVDNSIERFLSRVSSQLTVTVARNSWLALKKVFGASPVESGAV